MTEVRRLGLFFALAYFAQGISQDKAGMLDQVLKFYFTRHLGMTSTAFSDFLAPLMLPWVVKPLYGLISDLFPLGKWRRRSYLFLVTSLALGAFVFLIFAQGTRLIQGTLFCVGLGLAFGDVLVDALMVEGGQRTGFLRKFQSLQWMWISIAGVLASVLGGQLSQRFDAPTALKIASIIAIFPLLALIVASQVLVTEEPTRLSREQILASLKGLGSAFKSPTLAKMALILLLVKFAPNAGVAWYTFQTETLKLGQDVIGFGSAIGSVGGILGALLFNRFLAERLSPRRLLAVGLCASAASTLLHLLVSGAATLYPVLLIAGICDMTALLALLSLAGEACPKRAEGFTFAALMSINNLATQGGMMVGSRIFDATHKTLWPLILVSAGTTLLALFLVRLLPRTSAQHQ
jgi:MFS family permease